MEPLTHLLFGANMGRAGLNRKTAYATLTLTLAAESPDLDVFSRFGGSAFGFAHHRGFTHSFLGGILVAALVVARWTNSLDAATLQRQLSKESWNDEH